jgi:hypothetical protein
MLANAHLDSLGILVHYHAAIGLFSLEHRRGRCNGHGLCLRADLELDV